MSQFAQNSTHRAGISRHQLEGQGNQFVVTGWHVIEQQVFQHAHAACSKDLMAWQGAAVCRVHTGAVDANELHAQVGQPRDRLRSKGRQLGIEGVLGHVLIGPHQHARGQVVLGMLQMSGRQHWARIDGMNHAARPEIGRQVQCADRGAVRVVVQRGEKVRRATLTGQPGEMRADQSCW